jgi:hypothetical protein
MEAPEDYQLVGRFRWPASRRRQVATVLAIVAIFVATLVASSRLLRLIFEDLDVLAYLGLFVACWVGAGGALVPVPGVRPVSWLMIMQQGAALDPITVALVAGTAMALGQSSYFLATRRALRARAARREGRATPEAEERAVGPPAEAADPAADPAADEAPPEAGRLNRLRESVAGQARRHETLMPFLVALVPSPMTTVSTTASASLGTGYHRWVVPTLAGYLAFSALLAGVGRGVLTAMRGLLF